MAYPYYSNNPFYVQELQTMRDNIEKQIRQYQQNQVQAQQVPQVTQNFQLAPNPTNNELESKYVNNIDDVRNTFVMKTGIFITKDFDTLWVKDVSGNIKTFKTEEVIELDEKDKEILQLKKEIENMKGMIVNATDRIDTNINAKITDEKPAKLQSAKRSNTK